MKNLSKGYFACTDRTVWSGRADALAQEYLYQTVQYLDLQHLPCEKNKLHGYALLGFECDEGVIRNLGNPGACDGPMAFRQAAARMPIHQAFHFYDAGNVKCINHDLEAAQAVLAANVSQLLNLGLMPIVIGGGHETAWGHFQGIAQHYLHQDIAILNFDAHFDVRPLLANQKGSSGTPFRQINEYLKHHQRPFHYYCAGIQPFANVNSLFDYAHEEQIHYLLAEKMSAQPEDLSFIDDIIQRHQHIYVTLCLDVFNAALAPGVSAPQPLGIAANYVIEALRKLGRSKKVISLDIVELAPQYDIQQRTAKLAATLLMEYLHASK